MHILMGIIFDTDTFWCNVGKRQISINEASQPEKGSPAEGHWGFRGMTKSQRTPGTFQGGEIIRE